MFSFHPPFFVFAFWFCAVSTIQNFRIGIDRNANEKRWRLETNVPVKTRGEFPHRLIDENNCGTFIHTNDTAEPVTYADDVIDAKPEWILGGSPDEAEKFDLFCVHGTPSRISTKSSGNSCSGCVFGSLKT